MKNFPFKDAELAGTTLDSLPYNSTGLCVLYMEHLVLHDMFFDARCLQRPEYSTLRVGFFNPFS